MLMLLQFVLLMPPNPLTDTKEPLVRLHVPAFMNAPGVAVEKPAGEKKVLVLLIDFSDNQHTYVSSTSDSYMYGAQGL